MENISKKVFSYRWLIGGFFILLCTIFEIHGSSIGMYADFLSHPELSDVILGKPRQIRSDEYIVFTPFAFSQYFNNFDMISDIVRGASTNMFMTYGQAVWHPAIIFRPAQIGYLFLDAGSGLAFFWMSRLAILFLISFEFARLILQVNKKLCVLYAIMVAFSPLAQWWWSVNSIAEILSAGQGLVICWKLYLDNENLKQRFLFLAGFLYCAGVFIFGIYPAWQVSFGYVFLFCLIAVSFQKSNALKSLWRDKFFWIFGTAIMLAPIVHAVYVSLDMIELQMATEYPGKRFNTGGGWSPLSAEIFGMVFLIPFVDTWNSGGLNNLEFATFFSMAPLGWIMFFYLNFKLKQKDLLMTASFLLTFLFLFWETVGFPDWLSKFSLMSNTIENRVRTVIDFAQLLMVFRGLSLIKNSPPIFARLSLSCGIAFLSALSLYIFMPQWFGIKKFLTVFLLVSVSTMLFISPLNKLRLMILSLFMLAMGLTINPINSGVDVVYKMPVGQKISKIVQQDKNALWLVDNDGVWINDFPIMFGAPTINSVNVYPVLERWEKIDPERKNFERYNRYANIIVNLTERPTEFIDMGLLDHCKIELNVNALSILNIKYIFSRRGELENFSVPQVQIKKIYEDAGSFIYKIDSN